MLLMRTTRVWNMFEVHGIINNCTEFSTEKQMTSKINLDVSVKLLGREDASEHWGSPSPSLELRQHKHEFPPWRGQLPRAGSLHRGFSSKGSFLSRPSHSEHCQLIRGTLYSVYLTPNRWPLDFIDSSYTNRGKRTQDSTAQPSAPNKIQPWLQQKGNSVCIGSSQQNISVQHYCFNSIHGN